jgi:biotin carboxylase
MAAPVKTVAIVDAYNSGRLLAPVFARRGFACVHVQSRAVLPENYRHARCPGDFVDAIVHDGSIEGTLRALARWDLAAVVAGHEMGVNLADELSERIGVRSNGRARTRARRDKHEMMQVLAAAGIRTMAHFKAAALEPLLAWARARGRWPVVLKPLDSCGSEGVWLCHDERELAAAFARLAGKRNLLGLSNHEVAIQEFLSGPEYVVDTMSAGGVHHVTDVWRYRKQQVNGAPFVYDAVELLPCEGELQTELCAYATRVLDALEVSHGPAHIEIIRTDEGPVLVELGARLPGGCLPGLVAACTDHDPVELMADVYLGRPFAAAGPYRLRKHALLVWLISTRAGIVRALQCMHEVQRLPSFFRMSLKVQPGSPIARTVDLPTAPGQVDLVHERAEVIAADYRRLRELEASDFFTVSSDEDRAPGRRLATAAM